MVLTSAAAEAGGCAALKYGTICGMKTERAIRVSTTGVSDFESIVSDETKKYVDKTELLYELAKPKTDSQLFISPSFSCEFR